MKAENFCTYETAWCPGCGNFVILECLKTALEQLGKNPAEVLVAAGIGQAAKTPQYISANTFCGLHGRSLPAAVAAKIANENLTVIVDTGDGDSCVTVTILFIIFAEMLILRTLFMIIRYMV